MTEAELDNPNIDIDELIDGLSVVFKYPKNQIRTIYEVIEKLASSKHAKKCFLFLWVKYVIEKEDIHNITDLNDLAHTVFEYKELGHRNINRRSFLQN